MKEVEDMKEQHFPKITNGEASSLNSEEQTLLGETIGAQFIFRHSPVGIILFSKSGVIIDCNPKITDMLGVQQNEVIGFDAINELKNNTLKEILKEALAGRQTNYFGSFRIDEMRQLMIKADFYPLVGKRQTTVVAFVQDVTVSENAQALAEETAGKFKAIFHSIDDLIFIINSENILEDCNIPESEKVWLRYFGVCTQQIYNEILPANFAAPLGLAIAKLTNQPGIEQFDFFVEVEVVPEKIIWYNAKVSRRVNKNNQFVGITVVCRNITRRKEEEEKLRQSEKKLREAEEILRKAKEHAELSDKLKSAFLANMSHELRSPMNSIIGFSDLLLTTKPTPLEVEHYLDIINNNGKSLLNLINDIIDIAKVEVGQIKVNKTRCPVNEIFEELRIQYEGEKKLRAKDGLEIRSCPEIPDSDFSFFSDPYRLKQILRNLIGNALKFTDEGYIEFGFKTTRRFLIFYVKDTGIGISEKKQAVIFERFGQDESALQRNTTGAGLGLAISKTLVELLGGKIWVESVEGQGSTFFFSLPFVEVEKVPPTNFPQPKPRESYDWTGKTILIAEDEEMNFKLLEIVLKHTKAQVLRARNGKEAIAVCRKNNDIDIILMDVQMPILNGYEAVKQIRHFYKDVPVIAQTAFAMAGEKEKSLESGCNNYISKPINPLQLMEMIDGYFLD